MPDSGLLEYKLIQMSSESDDEGEGHVAIRERVRTAPPPTYQVVLLNDDYTPMEFVVEILEKYFNKDHKAAVTIMYRVHHDGKGVCGRYPREIAETKVAQVTEEARAAGYPLQCVMERI